MSPATQDLLDTASAARSAAYAPYSRFPVGAAVRLRDGRVFSGVNVENSSYPLGMCAERNAVAAAVRAGMQPGDLAAVAVVADAPDVVTPCGGCRQVLAEFAGPAAEVHLRNLRDGKTMTLTIPELLPHAFASASLPRP